LVRRENSGAQNVADPEITAQALHIGIPRHFESPFRGTNIAVGIEEIY